MRVAIEALFYGLLPFLFKFQIVSTVNTVTRITEFTVCEAFAVELQTLRLGAIARLTRSIRVVIHLRAKLCV